MSDCCVSLNPPLAAGEFYARVPKEPAAHARYRRVLLERAGADRFLQAQLLAASRDDLLFWVNTFVYIMEPRNRQGDKRRPVRIPFNTWKFQDRVLLELQRSLGAHDVWIPKSRDMGVTWQVLVVYGHAWLFEDDVSFKIGSRKEELVDSTDDPDTLFGKLDIILRHLPAWMLPRGFKWEKHRTFLHLYNPERNSVIDGESSNKDFARGGRRLSMFLDEFSANENQNEVMASTDAVTNQRIFVGTYKGTADEFYEKTHDPDQCVLRLHWREHPLKGAGRYTAEKGQLRILDESYVFPADYPFVLDGRERSPWYDWHWKRDKNLKRIAREIDMNPEGSADRFFAADVLDKVRVHDLRRPLRTMRLPELSDGQNWVGSAERCDGGELKLWCRLSISGKAPMDRTYRIGVDVAAGSNGSQASWSVIHVADCRTREQVAEYAVKGMFPGELARVCLALCRMFKGSDERGPLVCWEARGPGNQFGSRLTELGHSHIYLQRDLFSRKGKINDTPGWNPTRKNKAKVFGDLAEAMDKGRYTIRSREVVEQARHYLQGSEGDPVYDHVADTREDSEKEANHGDHVVAAALAWHAFPAQARLSDDDDAAAYVPEDPPFGSPAWSRREWERAESRRGQALANW